MINKNEINKMKKDYVKPTTKSVVLELESLLNTLSGGEQGNPGESTQVKRHRFDEVWDEEE